MGFLRFFVEKVQKSVKLLSVQPGSFEYGNFGVLFVWGSFGGAIIKVFYDCDINFHECDRRRLCTLVYDRLSSLQEIFLCRTLFFGNSYVCREYDCLKKLK